MIFRVGIENKNEGRSIAWALEHPGCFAYGADQAEAVRSFAEAARGYVEWITGHGGTWLQPGEAIRPEVEETFDVSYVNDTFDRVDASRGNMVESFFGLDWRPLAAVDIERGLQILEWSHADLLGVVDGLTADQRSRKHAGERWDIDGILMHIAAAEWWYQERIGHPFPRQEEDLPADPLESIRTVRAHFTSLLMSLEGLNQVVGLEGELWSPRKVLRRLAWHERDHTEHIRKLLRL